MFGNALAPAGDDDAPPVSIRSAIPPSFSLRAIWVGLPLVKTPKRCTMRTGICEPYAEAGSRRCDRPMS